MAVQEKTLTCGQLEWFYRAVEGDAASHRVPVVLLHGLPATGYSWRGVMSALEEQGFGAIAPDWIGFGSSAKPDRRTFAYTPDAYITALETFLAELGIDRCSLIVQGFIGSVGLQYALRHPDQIERMVILNAPVTSRAKLPWKMQQLGLPLAGEMFTQDPLLVDRTLEGGGGYVVKDEDLDVYRRPFLKSSDAGRALFAAVQNLRLPQATAEIEQGFQAWTKPVLVGWGMRDRWLPLSLAEAFVQTTPEAELIQLPDVGHYPQIDWFDKVNEAILPFLLRIVV
ncbi:alpha/beta fold hydrolase [Leptolyngbya sp. O-77]|uniref:alpha/beta fold hydrolase n=1 Tax=Leptolyngbya sp. O-77 TaxID=1080068 RepID=UPI00074D3CFB|nr:alpha/beta fold hydrolase [Leptolyngbya sp. O-77]BAU44451.1 Lipase 3 precursor [Leptolyngbya sp. O-77]